MSLKCGADVDMSNEGGTKGVVIKILVDAGKVNINYCMGWRDGIRIAAECGVEDAYVGPSLEPV